MSNEVNTSSDKSFYLIMLALIVGMGFYVSYDMEQRYGSDNTADDSGSTAEGSINSAEGSINTAEGSNNNAEGSTNKIDHSVSTSTIEKSAAQDDATVADAVEKVPAAKLKVESQKDIKPNAETSVIDETVTVAKDAPAIVVPTMSEAAKTVTDKVVETGSQAAKTASSFIPFTKTEEVTPKAVAPVVEEVIEETAAVAGSSIEAIPAMQPMQEFNPYNYPYRSRSQRPRSYQDNYYPQQRPYRYPNSNRFGGPSPNSYGNPYSNPYPNPNPNLYPTPYGYGYDQ